MPIPYSDLPSGTQVTVYKNSDGTWPARPTTRTDLTVVWTGPIPRPPVLPSGTGGAYNRDKFDATPVEP